MSDDVPRPAVLTHSFSVERHGRRVLHDVSFALPFGAVTALLGRNGAGKTTLLRAMAGLLPHRGTLEILGRPSGDEVRPRVGYVGQHAPLYRTLSVAETLRAGARLNPRWSAAHAKRLVDAAGLRRSARVGRLAPGQRMRLAVIMALAKRPDVLLLDEPFAPLDPVARTELAGTLMAEVAAEGTTVLLATHVVAEVDGMCDHVVLLGGGRVLLAGGIDEAVDGHRLAVGDDTDRAALAGADVVEVRPGSGGFTALVRTGPPPPAALTWQRPSLEELVLAYLREDSA
ncbi:ABC transporter ATP-binding protein [Virgisporangium aliadipatigenens]|uniref:ABC transporter ATP-binding protein n=1 Tax=Virgisporangium aliadipatigenens TaxID=741659 RepID=A0A8J3YJM2_9ACTN|nr:ABC transporter ATP-binding protein [Virgisporangium aliadipatigenens]GIJ45587.1 ABC transporter ATP-binding protein [Virgisporangium aliadipatigenens]